jgi:hypothetical protein
MMGYWMYQCDNGHSWEVYRDMEANERPEDALCPHGHEAVTLRKCPVVKQLETVIHDAGRVVDKLKNQAMGQGRFYVSLRDTSGVMVTSQSPMDIQDAIELCGRLSQMSDAIAKKYLSRWEPKQDGRNPAEPK